MSPVDHDKFMVLFTYSESTKVWSIMIELWSWQIILESSVLDMLGWKNGPNRPRFWNNGSGIWGSNFSNFSFLGLVQIEEPH